jgi:hypothetical protein
MNNLMNIRKMVHLLPKKMPPKIYPCKGFGKGGLYPICLCIEYMDFSKEKHRQSYKNCFITNLKLPNNR